MPRPHIPQAIRRSVIERAQRRCEYCQSPVTYSTQSFNVDHIIPLSLDGSSSPDNLALACSGCNSFKHTRVTGVDPVDGRQTRLFHPRQDDWPVHFGWDKSYTRMIGLTGIGRTTVEALQLNRDGVVNLRSLLILAGKHPPV